jgi:hypothetical protein
MRGLLTICVDGSTTVLILWRVGDVKAEVFRSRPVHSRSARNRIYSFESIEITGFDD